MAQANKNSEFNEYALSSELSLPDKPMFFRRHIMLLVEYLLYPRSIPGDNLLDRAYSISVIPALMQVMTVLAPLAKVYSIFERLPRSRRPGLITLTTKDIRDLKAHGDNEAMSQLGDHTPREKERFDYFVAFLLLVMSAGTYDRSQSRPKRLCSPEDTVLFKKFKYHYLGAHHGASAELFIDGHATVLIFGGTATSYDECIVDATFVRDNHIGSYHKFLAGQVHKGFYDSLFGVLNTAVRALNDNPNAIAPSSHGYFIHGPLTQMKCIMEDILTKAFQLRVEKKYLKPINLWVTGHSLGGALASLAMAYLQSIVEENDSLLDGWNIGGQDGPGAGSTVLEVMNAQFYKRFSSYDACSRCPTCQSMQLKSCNSCYDCKVFRLNMIQTLHMGCKDCKQRIEDKKEVFYKSCPNCTNDKTAKKYSSGQTRCKACDYCDECGGCEYCRAGKKCQDYKEHKELVVLRDCYTFGSPKVGDALFAKAFADNQLSIQEKSPYKPAYWRIANQGDLDYQHVGHLVEIYPSKRRPTVSLSKFEEALNRHAKVPKDLSKDVLEEDTESNPSALADPDDFIKNKDFKSLLRMAKHGQIQATEE
ncbi:hypothetical protein BGZ72_010790 [Mortierella alpina]|nr:hypothetical protein BGZ72_010790 [Mortierella alpina]